MRKEKQQFIIKAVTVSASGFLFTLLFGYLLKGSNIFIPRDPGFQFFIFGLSGSILYSTLKFCGMRNFIYVFLILFLAEIVRSHVTHVVIMSGRFLYYLGVAASIYVYFQIFIKQPIDLKFGKLFALAGLLATADFLIILITGIFFDIPDYGTFLIGQTFFGFLIGLGLGCGFEIGELVVARFDKK
jgi:hypothetical protein